MRILAIYDNLGKTIDRYTVVTDSVSGFTEHEMLGLAEAGDGFSQWTYGQYYQDGQSNRHLGKKIKFEELSSATQTHIAERLWGEQ